MSLLTKATDFIFSIVTEDETVKAFPKEFVSASAQWVRSWFLKDDPRTEAKLKDEGRSTDSKKTVIESKLEDKLEEPAFKAALEQQLAAFETQRQRVKNAISGSNVEAQGNVHIGDKGSSSGDDYDEKNTIKNSTIKAGRDFRMGDDVISNNDNVTVNNYYGSRPSGNANPANNNEEGSVKTIVVKLIADGKTEKAIKVLLDTPGLESSDHNTIILHSGRLNRLNEQLNRGLISGQEEKVERARINNAIMYLVERLS